MSYFYRKTEDKIKRLIGGFPIVGITGPRQSGKSTLIKHFIKQSKEKWNYYSFDNRELLLKVKSDPSLFIKEIDSNIAIDEAQKAPELFHSIKEAVDEGLPFKIILSGSANFLLMKNITESLAGRIGLIELLPFSLSEAFQLTSNNLVSLITDSTSVDNLITKLKLISKNKLSDKVLLKYIFRGGFPRLYFLNKNLHKEYFESYISTYIEKDLRDLTQVANLDVFHRFYKMLTYQTGNIINMQSISSDLGISSHTVKHYTSILETSYQCKFLPAYYSNKRKQLIKSSKIFHPDTGFVNFIYENDNENEMLNKGNWGAMLETFVFQELYKEIKDMTNKLSLFFWRTNNGAEVDFIINAKQKLFPIEVKSSIRIDSFSLRGLKSFMESESNKIPFGIVFYRGKDIQLLSKDIVAIPINLLF